jgi:hypothetical protein
VRACVRACVRALSCVHGNRNWNVESYMMLFFRLKKLPNEHVDRLGLNMSTSLELKEFIKQLRSEVGFMFVQV